MLCDNDHDASMWKSSRDFTHPYNLDDWDLHGFLVLVRHVQDDILVGARLTNGAAAERAMLPCHQPTELLVAQRTVSRRVLRLKINLFNLFKMPIRSVSTDKSI